MAWGPEAPLFRLHRDGRLELGSFRGGDWRLIGDHRFDPYSTMGQVSPDEHWLVLHGITKSRNEREIWAYETRSGAERLLMRRPRDGEALPLISPDGQTVAVFANYDPARPADDDSGLFLFDLASGSRKHLALPESIEPGKVRGWIRWSAAGENLFLFVSGDLGLDVRWEIYRISRATARFERIEGQFNGEAWNSELRVAGKLVPLAPHMLLPSRRSEQELEATDHSFRARVDPASMQLLVKDGAGNEHRVVSGRQTACGSSVAVKAWVGNFLIYELESAPYLYDARTHRSRRLGEPEDEYLWFSGPGVP